MELRQLYALVAVRDHGSFSAAADALATVQSNVSTHVRKLEDELGTQLVDRSAGRLTTAGELVAARARRISHELDALAADVTALDHEVSGTVRLGIIGTTARWLVPHLLTILPSRYPEVRLMLVEATRKGLESEFANGLIDIAVLSIPTIAAGVELQVINLFEEDLMLVVRVDHPLASRDFVEVADLHNMPLLLPPDGTSYRDDLEAAARQARVVLQPKVEMESLGLIAALTFEGCGPSILPAGAVPDYVAGDWKALSLVGVPPRVVGAAFRRRGLLAAPARAVLDGVTEVTYDSRRVPLGVRGLPPDQLPPRSAAHG